MYTIFARLDRHIRMTHGHHPIDKIELERVPVYRIGRRQESRNTGQLRDGVAARWSVVDRGTCHDRASPRAKKGPKSLIFMQDKARNQGSGHLLAHSGQDGISP